ncbi:MAG TPA: hypothetical protein VGF55_17325 [Gemmataceae bacterium]|jgi:hypothetical protein
MTTNVTPSPSTGRPPCPTCNAPTYLWDRATGERVCVNCTTFRPTGSSGNRPRPAGSSAAVRIRRAA